MSSSPSEPTLPVAAPALSPAPGARPARAPLFSAEAWSPLKVELFRSLYIATSVAQIGTWVREAGGPWLMELLTNGRPDQPRMVAMVLFFSNLPICLFSVFAGALADVLDRRRLLLVTQIWMCVVSAALGILTWVGYISPWGLLGLTFLVGTGTAAAGPALQALLPELVPRPQLPLAINLNSVALNVARALGPAMFIFVIYFLTGFRGVGASFLLTAASFIAAIWVLFRWKRPPQRAGVHGEEMWGAIRAGFLYNLHSPANRAILLRVFTFIVPAVVMWSQVPIIATRQLGLEKKIAEEGSAMLFAFVGIGAIFGVLIMPGLQKRYRIDPVVNVCTLCFAAGLVLLSLVHTLPLACLIMVFLGINWVIIPTNFNTATQTSVPLWVKGRAISFYLTVLFGSFTVAAIIWGNVTTATSISTSLRAGGISMAALLVLARWFPLTLNEGIDLAPLAAGGPAGGAVLPDLPPLAPIPPERASAEAGAPTSPAALNYRNAPVENGALDVTIQYDVEPTKVAEFLELMRQVAPIRRRGGATHWRLVAEREDEQGNGAGSANGSGAHAPADAARAAERGRAGERGMVRYAERFRFYSTAEYTRQSARMTRHDAQILRQAHGCLCTVDGATGIQTRLEAADLSDTFRAAAAAWTARQLLSSLDRAFDEAAATFDRMGALRERERRNRKPRYREVVLRIPEMHG